GGGIEVEPVTGLVLHLGEQARLAPETGRAREPVAFRLHADDLGMGVLRDLADEGAPIPFGHPVVGLDLELGVNLGLEPGKLVGVLRGGGLAAFLNVQALRVHGAVSKMRAVAAPSRSLPKM